MTDALSVRGLDATFDAYLSINGDSNDTVTFQTRDLDGDGPNAPVVTAPDLAGNSK